MQVLLFDVCSVCFAPADYYGRCPLCNLAHCQYCSAFHACPFGPAGFEDSPASSPRNSQHSQPEVTTTETAEATDDIKGEASNDLYVRLNDLWRQTWGPLTLVDKHCFLRVRYLHQLSNMLIYTTNVEEESPRQWGLQSDWKKILLYLNWDITGLVIINIGRQKCMLLMPGQLSPDFVDIDAGLKRLCLDPNFLGFAERHKDGYSQFACVEAWRHPNEQCRPKNLDRKLQRVMKVICERFDVRYWKEPEED